MAHQNHQMGLKSWDCLLAPTRRFSILWCTSAFADPLGINMLRQPCRPCFCPGLVLSMTLAFCWTPSFPLAGWYPCLSAPWRSASLLQPVSAAANGCHAGAHLSYEARQESCLVQRGMNSDGSCQGGGYPGLPTGLSGIPKEDPWEMWLAGPGGKGVRTGWAAQGAGPQP